MNFMDKETEYPRDWEILTLDHRASKWWSWDSNPGLSGPSKKKTLLLPDGKTLPKVRENLDTPSVFKSFVVTLKVMALWSHPDSVSSLNYLKFLPLLAHNPRSQTEQTVCFSGWFNQEDLEFFMNLIHFWPYTVMGRPQSPCLMLACLPSLAFPNQRAL